MPDKAPSSSLLPQLRSVLVRGSPDVSVLDGANRILESALISTSDEELGETCLAVVEDDLAVLTLRRIERGIEAPVQQRLGT